MSTSWIRNLSLASITSLVFAGCFGVTKTFPEKKYFLIEIENQNSGNNPPKGSGFKIRRFSISQRFEGKEFVYRKDNVTFESDFYNSFFISPSSNLREEFARGLLGLKTFEWDAGANTRIEPSHFIEITVSDLYGDFRNSPKAIVNLELFVYTENQSIPLVILKKTYKRSIEIQTKEAGDLVAGYNQALKQILQEIDEDLKGKILSR
jgi:cholesterol transport system auxiliary component